MPQSFASATDGFLAGDWDGNGSDTLAIRDGATYYVTNRHGDGAVMLCLGWFATLNLSAVIDYIPVPSHSRGFDNATNSHDDQDYSMPEPGGW